MTMPDFTPHEIVQELDRFIVGQTRAKRAVAVAVRNRTRRLRLSEDLRAEVMPRNILMIGPTGVGKTEIARRMARLTGAPFLKIEVTKFTQVGYVGRDVESIVRDLMDVAIGMVQEEKAAGVRTEAAVRANDRLLKYLLEPATAREIAAVLGVPEIEEIPSAPARRSTRATPSASSGGASQQPVAASARETARARNARKKRIAEALANHQLEERIIEIELEPEDSLDSMLEYMTTFDHDDQGETIHSFFTPPMLGNGRKRTRRLSVREARRLLESEEAQKLVDSEQVVEESVRRVEEQGIVFLDEFDKIVGSRVDVGPDVAGEGVQRDLLPIVEGSTVTTRYGPIKTDHVLWIAAGAFHKHKPSDLIPELQGRFPLRVELDPLTEEDFKAILVQPEHSLTRQYQALLATEDVRLSFSEDGLAMLARYACQMNERYENIGARRLHTILERVLEDVSFDAPTMAGREVLVDAAFVQERLAPIVADEDMSKYIL
jgi:ATP-dependent HslUV protease ATP-binding subunit HslU